MPHVESRLESFFKLTTTYIAKDGISHHVQLLSVLCSRHRTKEQIQQTEDSIISCHSSSIYLAQGKTGKKGRFVSSHSMPLPCFITIPLSAQISSRTRDLLLPSSLDNRHHVPHIHHENNHYEQSQPLSPTFIKGHTHVSCFLKPPSHSQSQHFTYISSAAAALHR